MSLNSFWFLWLILLCFSEASFMDKQLIPVGVILDLNSSLGSLAHDCIFMALEDFYKQNPYYETRLSLRIKDSENDVVTAAFAALNLINSEKVHAIIGPQTSEQARFMVELGDKHHVPIISFSATSPSLSSTRSHFFIRTAQDDRFQVEAIASITAAYGWREIILIYEDTDYGNGLVPYLTDALEEVDTGVSSKSAIDPYFRDTEVSKELRKLKEMPTKIFLLHMTADLGSKFLKFINKAGMMSEGYAWIFTQRLSTVLDPTTSKVRNFMQGALGVRPMLQKTKERKDFRRRWEASAKAAGKSTALSLFGYWAYDTVQALAIAEEEAEKENVGNKSQIERGLRIANTILGTKFQGVSGDFGLVEGWLKPSVLEIFNVIGHKERIIGYWSPQRGCFQDLSESIAKENLKKPLWPGDTTEQPKKMRIGVPVRKGFTELVKVERSSLNGKADFSGFAIDVFSQVVKRLPIPFAYEFVPFPLENATYDDLLSQVKDGKFDAAVGDITIVGNRTKYVDFTLPYCDSSVVMVVSSSSDKMDKWIFFRPFSWGVWIVLPLEFFFIGFFMVLYEMAKRFGSRPSQMAWGEWLNILTDMRTWLPFFADRQSLDSHRSRFMCIVAVILLFIVSQCYVASLISFMLEKKVELAFELVEIKERNLSVGYQKQSFVKGILIEQFKFDQSKLKAYDTPEDYARALSLGSEKDGVDAIFDETPYVNLFLKKYGSHLAMTETTYKTLGLGFAFPLKSSLATLFSRAIANVIEDKDKFQGIKCQFEYQSASVKSDNQSLTFENFIVLHMIVALICALSIIVYPLWDIIVDSLGNGRDPSSPPTAHQSNEENQIQSPQGPSVAAHSTDHQSRNDNSS